MTDHPERQIAEVIRDERNRGRRGPASSDARRRQLELKRGFEMLLARGTEAEFCEAMRALGVAFGSPRFQKALQIWRENRQS
jgi:hypothetical protein